MMSLGAQNNGAFSIRQAHTPERKKTTLQTGKTPNKKHL